MFKKVWLQSIWNKQTNNQLFSLVLLVVCKSFKELQKLKRPFNQNAGAKVDNFLLYSKSFENFFERNKLLQYFYQGYSL